MPSFFQRGRIALGGLLFSLVLAGCGANPQASLPSEPGASATPVPAPSQPVPSATVAPAQPAASVTVAPAQPAASVTVAPVQPTASATAVPPRARTAPAVPPALVPTAPSITGEIPDLILATMLADLSQRAGVAPNELTIIVAEAVTWSDGSLGCPQPGMMYPQVLIEGYRAVLLADGREYAYHSDGRGNAFYCAQPAR